MAAAKFFQELKELIKFNLFKKKNVKNWFKINGGGNEKILSEKIEIIM